MEKRDLKKEFESVVSEVISPTLKAVGFKKNGNNFFREVNGVGQVFNIQQSQWNTADDNSFVFNIGLFEKSIYVELRGEQPARFPKEFDCHVQLRNGHLIKKEDSWFHLKKGSSLASVKASVSSELNTLILSFFEQYKAVNDWMPLMDSENGFLINPMAKFMVMELCGHRLAAEKFLNDLFNKARVPKVQVTEMRSPNGRTERETSEPTVDQAWVNHIVRFAGTRGVTLIEEALTAQSGKVKNWWERLF